jgi:hypothetical protein
MQSPGRRAFTPGRTLAFALLALAMALLGSLFAGPAGSAEPARSRPAVTSWVVRAAGGPPVAGDYIAVRIRARRPVSLRVAVVLRSHPNGGGSRVTVWRQLQVGGHGMRTVRLRRTAASLVALGCRKRWLVPRMVLRTPLGRRLGTKALARRLLVGQGGCEPVNGVAPWLPPGRKPMIFDIGQVTPWGPGLEEALDQVAATGADTVRLLVEWRDIAPAVPPPGFDPTNPADTAYDFSAVDRVMRAAAARGLRMMLTVGGPIPAWGSWTGGALSDPRATDFGDFVRAVARRYNGAFTPEGDGEPLPGAALWSVWNEPNLDLFLRPQFRDGLPYSPILYRRLYMVAQAAIRTEAPGTPIVIGETAPFGADGNVGPLTFARGVLCLDDYAQVEPACDHGAIRAAGWGAHPYTQIGHGPFDTPDWAQYVVTIANLRNLEEQLDQGTAAGVVPAGFPIYVTEFGFQSEPDPRGWPLQSQADFLSISEQIEYRDERVASTAQYLIEDDPPEQGGGFRGFESGLRFYDGTAKPSYDAYRLPLVVKRNGDQVSLWGLVRPARTAVEAAIRVRDGTDPPRMLGSVTTSAAGVLSLAAEYRPGRVWQLIWRAPDGQTYHGPWTGAYEFSWPARDRQPR